MADQARLTINGRTCEAEIGLSLCAAAEAAGIHLPVDCHDGTCETCRIEIISGDLAGGEPRFGRTALACQAKVAGDCSLRFDPIPREMRTSGTVLAFRDLSREIVELRIAIARPVPYLPGQYVKVSFAGLPERNLCPTLSLDGLREIDELVFHIRRLHDGAIGAALGSVIRPGSKLRLRGPFGQGFLRPWSEATQHGRILMVSSAAGFAPIWSMAVAARLGQPDRPLVLIVSARDPRNLYMRPALEWLAQHGVSEIILTASGAHPMPPARHGRASEFLPALMPGDTVHVAGDAAMCRAIQQAASRAKVPCHAIPFLAAATAERSGIGQRIARILRSA